jgi:SET domain-containing protein
VRPKLNPQRCRFRLAIGRSAIDRFGVFTLEAIPARKKVIQYTGKRIGLREIIRRSKKILRKRNPDRNYLFSLNDRWSLDASVGGSGAEFANHSCDPNLIARVTRTSIWFVSRKRIGTGEELTLDYKIREGCYPFPCHCGSPKCRGTMERK